MASGQLGLEDCLDRERWETQSHSTVAWAKPILIHSGPCFSGLGFTCRLLICRPLFLWPGLPFGYIHWVMFKPPHFSVTWGDLPVAYWYWTLSLCPVLNLKTAQNKTNHKCVVRHGRTSEALSESQRRTCALKAEPGLAAARTHIMQFIFPSIAASPMRTGVTTESQRSPFFASSGHTSILHRPVHFTLCDCS